ncbi:MAG: PAS domain S-box protein [Helicobacteraceae bacterium]|nr:PAS domain S-box protein [Candidatus Sulfurimonas ponti]
MYQDIFEKSTDGMLIIEDDRFIDCNDSVVKMLRYEKKEQLLNTRPHELSPKYQSDGRTSVERVEENKKYVLEHGSMTLEWIHLRSDGEPFWVEVVLTDMSTDNKIVLLVVWREIGEKKRLEEENSYQHMLLESVLHSTKDVIFYKDYSNEDGRYIGCNCSFEKFVGKSKEEIIGKNDIELFGKEVGEFFRGKDLDVINAKVDITNEEWVIYPNGDKVLMSTTKSLLRDKNDNIIGIMGIARDITQTHTNQQKILQQSQSLKEAAKIISQNVIHSETDLKGIITKVSKAFCDISGYSKDELLGKAHNIVRHEDMSSSVYKDMWQTIKSGNDWSGEIKNKRKDGSYY